MMKIIMTTNTIVTYKTIDISKKGNSTETGKIGEKINNFHKLTFLLTNHYLCAIIIIGSVQKWPPF